MLKGDIVTIINGSYAKSVIAGKLVKELLNCGCERGKSYVVIETGCGFPLESNSYCSQPNKYRNNTVIQAIGGGKVVFIHGRFLHSIVKSVREVTMAEVCKQFGQDVKIKKD